MLDDLRGNRVVRRLRQQERRELDDTALVDPPSVNPLGELARRGHAEVRRNGPLEARPRAAPIFAPRRGRDSRQAQVVAAAPVSGDRTERRKACVPPIRRDTHAVDPGAACDRNAPPAFRAGTKDCERIVADVHALGPAAPLDGGSQRIFFRGKIDSGHQQGRDLRNPTGVVTELCFAHRLFQESLHHGKRSVDAEVLRRAQPAPNERKHGAVAVDERDVRLGVAAVDGENGDSAHLPISAWNCGRCAAPASSKRSTRSSASGCWPISGWVSKALRATAGSPLTAACAASRS